MEFIWIQDFCFEGFFRIAAEGKTGHFLTDPYHSPIFTHAHHIKIRKLGQNLKNISQTNLVPHHVQCGIFSLGGDVHLQTVLVSYTNPDEKKESDVKDYGNVTEQ